MTVWQPIETHPRDGTPFLIRVGDRIGVAFVDPREYEGVKHYVSGAAICGPDPYNDRKPGMAMASHFIEEATEWAPVPT